MHMEFTEEERRYLIREPFDWHASSDAPPDVKKSIKRKILLINEQRIGQNLNLREKAGTK